jgi:hypothetical protein
MSHPRISHEFEITEKKRERGFSRFVKEGRTMLIVYKDTPIRFDISFGKKPVQETNSNFKEAAKDVIKDKEDIQGVIAWISQEWLNLTDSVGISNANGHNGNSTAHNHSNNLTDITSSTNANANQEKGQSNKVYADLSASVVNPSRDLDPHVQDRDYAEFVIKTIKKTVKSEDSLVRQLLYVGLSAKSNNPQSMGIRAPTSEGKTYAVIESIIKYFPKKDV